MRGKTPEQAAVEMRAASKVLRANGRWMRPLDVARESGQALGVALAALLRMHRAGLVERRAYLVPRVHVGRERVRKTSREIVEYRIVIKHRLVFPDWLSPPFVPPPAAARTVHRLC